MQVIGITEVGEGYSKQKAYVAIVTHHELQKVADKAGYNDKLSDLKVGQDHPLSEGYDFRNQLTDAIKKMEEAYKAFAKIAPIAAQFAGIVANKSDEATPTGATHEQ